MRKTAQLFYSLVLHVLSMFLSYPPQTFAGKFTHIYKSLTPMIPMMVYGTLRG